MTNSRLCLSYDSLHLGGRDFGTRDGSLLRIPWDSARRRWSLCCHAYHVAWPCTNSERPRAREHHRGGMPGKYGSLGHVYGTA